jgi:hypothetical protein
MGRLGGSAFSVNESTLTASAGHFHGRYHERAPPDCLGLSSLDPGDTETDTKKRLISRFLSKYRNYCRNG